MLLKEEVTDARMLGNHLITKSRDLRRRANAEGQRSHQPPTIRVKIIIPTLREALAMLTSLKSNTTSITQSRKRRATIPRITKPQSILQSPHRINKRRRKSNPTTMMTTANIRRATAHLIMVPAKIPIINIKIVSSRSIQLSMHREDIQRSLLQALEEVLSKDILRLLEGAAILLKEWRPMILRDSIQAHRQLLDLISAVVRQISTTIKGAITTRPRKDTLRSSTIITTKKCIIATTSTIMKNTITLQGGHHLALSKKMRSPIKVSTSRDIRKHILRLSITHQVRLQVNTTETLPLHTKLTTTISMLQRIIVTKRCLPVPTARSPLSSKRKKHRILRG